MERPRPADIDLDRLVSRRELEQRRDWVDRLHRKITETMNSEKAQTQIETCMFIPLNSTVGGLLPIILFFCDHSIKRLSLRLCCQARGRSLTENFGNSVQAVRENPEYSYTELARVEIDEIPASVKGRFRCEDGFLCECRVKVLKHCPPPSYQPLQTYSVNRRLRNDGTYRSNVPPVSTYSIQLRLMGLEN